MNRVRILKNGCALRQDNGWKAIPTTTLIESDDRRILVDPGNHPDLLDLLDAVSLGPEDIDTIFLTHHHIDHTMKMGLLPAARIFDYEMVYDGEMAFPHGGRIDDLDMRVLNTPGHTMDHVSLLVPTEDGETMICGDLFWWCDDEEPTFTRRSMLSLIDNIAEDTELLGRSRASALDLGCDLYIPGHGRPFRLVDQ